MLHDYGSNNYNNYRGILNHGAETKTLINFMSQLRSVEPVRKKLKPIDVAPFSFYQEDIEKWAKKTLTTKAKRPRDKVPHNILDVDINENSASV